MLVDDLKISYLKFLELSENINEEYQYSYIARMCLINTYIKYLINEINICNINYINNPKYILQDEDNYLKNNKLL